MTILYHGTLADLYPHVAVDEHWRDHILECLANDSAHFGMEKNEPLCKNKVPREGLVLRIDNDPVPQAFKLKSNLFFERESKLIDKGEVDVEVQS